MRNFACLFVGLGLSVLLSGCNSSTEETPELLVPVTGVVKLEGQPVGGVSVSFIPDSGTTGAGGYAVSDPQGKFTVLHRSQNEGIEPGKYRVVMSRVLTPDGGAVPPGESAMDHNASETLLPQYTDAEQTPFRPEVKENMEPLTFELTSK